MDRASPGNISAATLATGASGLALPGRLTAAQPSHGGCDFVEDPNLDARVAEPVWLPDPDALIALGPAVGDDADPFSLWSLPGRKSLVHDGQRLLLRTRLGRRVVRLALSLSLKEGTAYAFAVPAGPRRAQRTEAARELAEALEGRTRALRGSPVTRTMLVHMRALQALDAEAAGASERDIADIVFGAAEPGGAFSDSAQRANVRYLLKAGKRLRDGGYRDLLRPRVGRA